MTTNEFRNLYTGSMSDYLYRVLHTYNEMYKVWESVGIATKLHILELTKSCPNYETVFFIVHRALLIESLQWYSNINARKMVLGHISILDKCWGKTTGQITIETRALVADKHDVADKMNTYERRVYDMFNSFPAKPKSWLERSVYFADRLGMKSEEIFSLHIPNPYQKAEICTSYLR